MVWRALPALSTAEPTARRCFGKGLDNFAPVGPVLVHPSLFDPASVNIYTRLNGETMQKANTSDLISDVRKIIHHFSKGTTLERGSLILTGTPEGASLVRRGVIRS
jgi:2-keto-4-pentenoate hydratase/2-oxohepta-3-ene-1,7-dioic acid hydratase in catechol pathway